MYVRIAVAIDRNVTTIPWMVAQDLPSKERVSLSLIVLLYDPRTRRRRRIAREVVTSGRNVRQARRQIKIQLATLKGIHFAKGKREAGMTVLWL